MSEQPEPAASAGAESTPAPAPRAFGRAYWMCNSIEMLERLAYFGIRSVVPIYIMQATEPGGLHLTAIHKGWIYAWWAVFQSFLPMVTGGYADRYGYKRVLTFAISMNVAGYLLMAFFPSYYGFFAGILVLATGTAFFKPALQGSLAQNLTKANSSVGWGVFYWVVNIGAFGAPFLATIILGRPHSAEGWRNLFIASAAYTACNLLLLLTFKDVPSGASKTETPLQVLWRTLTNITDPRLIAWLLIMSCFWLMMYQLWDLHPNFIEDWVDSSSIAAHVPFDAWQEYGDRGIIRVPQQILLNLNAGLIILLMLPVSWLVRHMRTLSAMLIGMTVATGGVVIAGLTGNGWFLLLGIVFFSLGEMLTGPKKNEYLGLIAPKGKKGLYLGYVNIPVGIGVGIGSMLAGYVYGAYGEKASLALNHLAANPQLVSRAARSIDWSDSIGRLPGLLGIDRNDAIDESAKQLGLTRDDAERALRDAFRFDQGQLVNLGMAYLAVDPELTRAAGKKLGNLLAKQAGDGGDGELGARLARGDATLDQVPVARFVHLLPKALDLTRAQVWEVVRDRVNRDRASKEKMEGSAIVAMLWERFGRDRDTLTNLALEYLAQGTTRLHDAASTLDDRDPKSDIEKRLGIGRTKSFAALSAAMGADDDEVEKALSSIGTRTGPVDKRAWVYVVKQVHRRFIAVARRDWEKNVMFLESLIEDDDDARAVVAEAVGRSDGKVDYQKLAGKRQLIQDALAVKRWSAVPDQAGQLLGINPFEARALVATDTTKAPTMVTRMLWDRYDPQYRVWLPFAAIGVLAAIALAIFGQMAKRWSDMNA